MVAKCQPILYPKRHSPRRRVDKGESDQTQAGCCAARETVKHYLKLHNEAGQAGVKLSSSRHK